MQDADAQPPGRLLAALLRERKEELLRAWTRRVLGDPRIPEASRLSEEELRDHVPMLVDELVRVLEAAEESEASGRDLGTSEAAVEHARHRLATGYALTPALREFSHFRTALLDLCTAEGVRLEGGAAELVHATIDHNMITDAAELERASLEEERRQAAFRERFIGILGHDLRAPLAAITLAAGMLVNGEDTPERQRPILRRVVTSAERMGRMIHDLLDLSRVRHGGSIPIARRPTELRSLCQTVIQEHETAGASPAIELDATGPVEGTWDPDRLTQVLQNLIGNALDYSPSDVPVRVTLREQGDEALLAVHNDGPEISAEMMPHLFDPFRQGTQSGRASHNDGLGLGLFITKHIIEAHGGRVEVTSTPDAGTTFTLHLPRGRRQEVGRAAGG